MTSGYSTTGISRYRGNRDRCTRLFEVILVRTHWVSWSMLRVALLSRVWPPANRAVLRLPTNRSRGTLADWQRSQSHLGIRGRIRVRHRVQHDTFNAILETHYEMSRLRQSLSRLNSYTRIMHIKLSEDRFRVNRID